MRNKSITQVAFVITTITIICKVLGFIKNSFLAYYFGTSPVVDAYVMTFSIGTITCGWIAGLVGNFTPLFNQIVVSQGRGNALGFACNVHNFLLVIVFILVGVLEFLAPMVVHFVAPGFNDITFHYTVWFFRIYLISIPFYASYRFFNEFLNCNQEHIWASAPDVLLSSCCIMAIIISNHIGDSFLIFGYVVAIMLEWFFVHMGSSKIGFRFKLMMKWNDNLKRLIVLAIPIFISNTISEINILIDKIFASRLESGIVASLEYANTMRDFAFQVGTVAMVTIFFPMLSSHWANGEIENFKKRVTNGISFLTIIYMPIIAGIIVVGDLAINVVFKRGNFSSIAAEITTTAFVIYSVSLIALATRSVFVKAFNAMQKTKITLFVSSIEVLLNISLNLILVNQLGYIGLAVATSASALLCLPLYFVIFNKLMDKVSLRGILKSFGKSFFSSVIMYHSLLFLRGKWFHSDTSSWQQFVLLLLMVLIGVVLYCLVCYLLKVEEIVFMISGLRERIKSILKRHP